MSDDNDNGNVIDFSSRNKIPQPEVDSPKPTPGRYEFHFFPHGAQPDGSSIPGEVEVAQGYLKFGPQFLAVVEGPEDSANVTFAVSTGSVKYIKQLASDGSIQGTLSV